MAEGTPVTKNLEENEVWFRSRCEGCADIKLQPMLLGKGGSVHVLAIYVENTVPNLILEESVLGRMFIEMTDKTPGSVSGSGSEQPRTFGGGAAAHKRRGDGCDAGGKSAASGGRVQ